jgi:hypothetical protein
MLQLCLDGLYCCVDHHRGAYHALTIHSVRRRTPAVVSLHRVVGKGYIDIACQGCHCAASFLGRMCASFLTRGLVKSRCSEGFDGPCAHLFLPIYRIVTNTTSLAYPVYVFSKPRSWIKTISLPTLDETRYEMTCRL